MNMKEQWKDIEGFDGLYQVSTLGRVKRVEREIMQFNHQLQKEIPIIYPKKYLKAEVLERGYRRVTLSVGNIQKKFAVHRLVAMAFLPNPEGKPHVHHKNHVSHDNRLVNLEWVTPIENETYKWATMQPMIKTITPDGEVKTYYTQMECARDLKIPRNGIQRCLSGEVDSYRGYTFHHISPTK